MRAQYVKVWLFEQPCKNGVFEESFGTSAAAFYETFEATVELGECLGPLLLSHVHFPTALHNDTNNAWILNCGGEVLTQFEDLFHPALLLEFNAHLDFESEDLEQHAALAGIKDLNTCKVNCLGCNIWPQASLLQVDEHLLERRELLGAEVHLCQTQRGSEPKSLVVCFQLLKN